MLKKFFSNRASGNDEMSFMDHLEDLRWSIARSLLAVALVGVVLFIEKAFLFDVIILGPMHTDFWTYRMMCKLGQALNMGDTMCIGSIDFTLTSIELTSQFMIHLKSALTVGLIVTFPYILFELWKFVSPALYSKEKNKIRGVVLAGSILFYIGLLFGYYLIAPFTIIFLGSYQVSDLVPNTISLQSYMETVSGLSLTSGLVFEFPLVIYFLALLGLITPQSLRQFRKIAMVVCLFLAAIITPSPDMFSQTIVTVPLYGLYEVGILVAARVYKRKKAQEEEEETEEY